MRRGNEGKAELRAQPQAFIDTHRSTVAMDLEEAPVFLAASQFDLNWEQERNPDITFTDVKTTVV